MIDQVIANFREGASGEENAAALQSAIEVTIELTRLQAIERAARAVDELADTMECHHVGGEPALSALRAALEGK